MEYAKPFEVDGAHEGVAPSVAVGSILKSEPLAPGDRRSHEEMRKIVQDAPTPDPANDPWEGVADMGSPEAEAAYDRCCYSMAHALMQLWGSGKIKEDTPENEIYEAFKAEEPYRLWLENFGGISGFQWGYTVNLFRFLVGQPADSNPALVTLEVEDD